jgi:stage V sporulation protein AD
LVASKRIGQQTLAFQNPPVILGAVAIVGQKEGEGPLGGFFDQIEADPLLGEKTWERAESRLLQQAANLCLQKADLVPGDVDFLLAGDLLNQIIASSFCARELNVPFLGLYGACSTMAQGMALGGMLIDGGMAELVLNCVSSHHETAERQYRYPTEFASQRTQTAQWTVTGAGAIVLGSSSFAKTGLARVTEATLGRVVDYGIKDPNNMGAAMAPAAADTIAQHLADTDRKPSHYDAIITGDLGTVGKKLVLQLLEQKGWQVPSLLHDCGEMIFDAAQDAHAGGSGCACSATVFCSYWLKKLQAGALKRLLFVATGALFSPTSYQQGESIPSVAHAVVVEGMPNGGGS